MNLAEKYGPWAAIAGASEGVGRAIARALAAAGIPSVLLARREAPLAALRDEIRADYGVECAIATVDMSAPDACERIADAVGAREIGLFVNNAGSDTNGSRFLDRDVEAWAELVQRNVVTMMRCAHHFAAPMRARGKGGLLLVNSGACYGGAGFLATYSASKAFMLCFAEGLWSELRPHGVDVLTIALGQTDTPAYRTLLTEKGLPFPTNWAAPEDVARVALERLPHGPIQNWGLEDDVVGYAISSAAMRRERVLMIDKASRSTFGDS